MFALNLPTKFERNKWFQEIKNIKQNSLLANIFQTQNLIRTNSFKIDFVFGEEQAQLKQTEIKNRKDNKFDYELFHSLQKLHNLVNETFRQTELKSRRKSMDIMELNGEESKVPTHLQEGQELLNDESS